MRKNLLGVMVMASIIMLGVWPLPATGTAGEAAGPTLAWTRTLEPVTLTGADLGQFNGVNLGDLFVYAFDGSTWAQISYQFDEVDADGTYTSEDGVLDANDELVFMAVDLGFQADTWEWVDDADAQAHSRYEVAVTDPLHPAERGWAYVYQSTTLVPNHDDYVDWDAGNQRVVAGTYIAGYDPSVHISMDSLELNGYAVDVLDRTKIQLSVTCYIDGDPFAEVVNEEDFSGEWDIVPSVDGAVRVGGGTTEASTWSYHSLYLSDVVWDLDALTPPQCDSLEIHWFRVSTDWLNPTDTGMAPTTYYDSNLPGGVPIDGSPDSVPTTPPVAWRQISGGRGSVIQVLDVSVGTGTLANYYKDDSTLDQNDTGDYMSFGDAGFRVDEADPAGLSGELVFESVNFVLDPAQPNVGETFRAYFDEPLQATATEQAYDTCAPQEVGFLWSPYPAIVGVQETFTGQVLIGEPPFNYGWLFGDDGSSTTGKSVAHTFSETGLFPVTLTVSNACGIAESTRNVFVLEPGEASLVYMPMMLRNASSTP